MAINKQHPDYLEYIKKCQVISNEFCEKEEIERAKYPNWRGKDHPSDPEVMVHYRKFSAALKELKKEYSYLFEDDEE